MTGQKNAGKGDNDNDDDNDDDETVSIGEEEVPQKQPPSNNRWVSLADRLNPNRAGYDPILKASWKTTMSKEERNRIISEDKRHIRELKQRGKTILPFENTVDTDDHCETSSVAYSHIVPILEMLAETLNKAKSELKLYDPYYCAGGTVQHFQNLGFPNIYNQPQDFYKMIRLQNIPDHDVVVTNPPYSGDHFDRLVQFLKQNGKPFLLLLPDHFAQKPAYKREWGTTKDDESTSNSSSCPPLLFLTPPQRYHYWTPEGRRPTKEANNNSNKNTKSKKKRKHSNLHLGERNSPFNSLWFFSLEPALKRKKVLKAYSRGTKRNDINDNNDDNGKKSKKRVLRLLPGCLLHKDFASAKKAEQRFRGGEDDEPKSPSSSSSLVEAKKAKKRRKKERGENKKSLQV